MASTTMSATAYEIPAGPDGLDESAQAWLRPAVPAAIGRGLFAQAIRAASLARHPVPHVAISTAPPITGGSAMAPSVVLEAWRATERELAGMTGDSPDQEYLEANVMILRETYQRLFSERMRR